MRKDIMISGICALSLIMLTQNAYLELNDNNSQKYVMLVNAETGKEIYLM